MLPGMSVGLAVVTGATGGLGAAICDRLLRDGFDVLPTDLAAPDGGLALDVSDEGAWRDLARYLIGRSCAVLVNNAGIGTPTTVDSETVETWNRVLAVSQHGAGLGMKHLGPLFAGRGGGAIVNVGSVLGVVGGFGGHLSYAASKGALTAMTRSAALHWAADGVRINVVHPGFIETPAMALANDPRSLAKLRARTPMHRLGRAEEIAAVISFLAGADASFVTGSELIVDGGWTAQ